MNKTDAIAADVALDAIVPVEVSGKFAAVVRVSAVTGAGLEELERELGSIVEGGSVESGGWGVERESAAGGGARAGARRARASRGDRG